MRWELGSESVLLVNGVEIGRRVWEGPPLQACSGQTHLGFFVNAAGAPVDWSIGDVDSLRIGGSRWEFDGQQVPDLTGEFPGNLIGGAATECD